MVTVRIVLGDTKVEVRFKNWKEAANYTRSLGLLPRRLRATSEGSIAPAGPRANPGSGRSLKLLKALRSGGKMSAEDLAAAIDLGEVRGLGNVGGALRRAIEPMGLTLGDVVVVQRDRNDRKKYWYPGTKIDEAIAGLGGSAMAVEEEDDEREEVLPRIPPDDLGF